MARQRIGFGPWSSSLDSGTWLELSAFWRRRMAGLARLPLGRRVNRRWTVVGVVAAFLVGATPLIEFSPLAANDQVPGDGTDSAPIESKPFVWKFSNGVEVELIGLAKHPSKDQSWWRPDGSPLTDASLPSSNFRSDNESREVAFRWRNLPADKDVTRRWTTLPKYGGGGGAHELKERDGSVVQVEGLVLADDTKDLTVSVTLSVESSPWKTLYTSDGRHASAQGSGVEGKPRGLAFAPAHEANGGTVITATFNLAGDSGRVIAIDRQGKVHTASRVTEVGISDFVQGTFTFDKLPLDQVKGFQLQMQSRRLEIVEFRNVSLHEGHATRVAIAPPGEATADDRKELQDLIGQSLPKAGEKFDRSPILGPITSGESGEVVKLDHPTDEEVLRVNQHANRRLRRMSDAQKEEYIRQVERVEKHLVSESVDPARVHPLIGSAKQVHAIYHCILHLKGARPMSFTLITTTST